MLLDPSRFRVQDDCNPVYGLMAQPLPTVTAAVQLKLEIKERVVALGKES